MHMTYLKNKKRQLLLGVERTAFMLFCTSDCKYYNQEGEQNMTVKMGIIIVE